MVATGALLLPQLSQSEVRGVSALAVERSRPAPQRASALNTTAADIAQAVRAEAVLAEARTYLKVSPKTITDFHAARSEGGTNDYYSEGPYWWPDPANPDGPYVQRDGQRNPDYFNDHHDALADFGDAVSALTAAYLLSGDSAYAHQAIEHLEAWFVTAGTRMNPSLTYAQAIKGLKTGRGIGIIDTVALIRVAESIRRLAAAGVLGGESLVAIRTWFSDYGTWLTTDPYGIDERDHGNNHSTWWGAQVAAYARVSERADLLEASREQYRKQLAHQMSADGTFQEELSRTRPFHYTIYTLDAWATLADLASGPDVDLWTYDAGAGTLQRAVEWFVPYLADPSGFPYPSSLEPDLEPQRAEFLVPAAEAYKAPKYLELWGTLPQNDHRPESYLILREYPANG